MARKKRVLELKFTRCDEEDYYNGEVNDWRSEEEFEVDACEIDPDQQLSGTEEETLCSGGVNQYFDLPSPADCKEVVFEISTCSSDEAYEMRITREEKGSEYVGGRGYINWQLQFNCGRTHGWEYIGVSDGLIKRLYEFANGDKLYVQAIPTALDPDRDLSDSEIDDLIQIASDGDFTNSEIRDFVLNQNSNSEVRELIAEGRRGY